MFHNLADFKPSPPSTKELQDSELLNSSCRCYSKKYFEMEKLLFLLLMDAQHRRTLFIKMSKKVFFKSLRFKMKDWIATRASNFFAGKTFFLSQLGLLGMLLWINSRRNSDRRDIRNYRVASNHRIIDQTFRSKLFLKYFFRIIIIMVYRIVLKTMSTKSN